MAVHVADPLRWEPRTAQRRPDRPGCSLALGMGSGRVVAVGGEAVAHDLRQNRETRLTRHVLPHQDQHSTPFAQREPLPVPRVRGRRFG